MAIGIDTSNWKPRKVKGTPAATVRNIFASGIIGVGVLLGVLYQFSGFTSKFRGLFDKFYEDPVEEVERKQLIASGIPLKTGDQIRDYVEEYNMPDKPHH